MMHAARARRWPAALFASLGLLAIGACEDSSDEPIEDAAEDVEDAAEDAQDAAEDAVDETEDAIDDATDGG